MATTDKDVETAKTTTVEERIDELRKRRKAALTPGGRDAAAKQHDRGKLTARERVQLLMDKGSFVETDPCARCTANGSVSTECPVSTLPYTSSVETCR